MALTGVLRPGHAQIRVLDLEAAVHHYRDVMGLVETGRDAQGRVYLKCWDERDHNSVILRQADRAGLDFFAFKVLDKATLEKLDADLQAYGIKTQRIPAGEMLETGERVRFEIPSGHQIELFAEKTAVGNGLAQLQLARVAGVMRFPRPQRMHTRLQNGVRRGEIRLAHSQRDDVLHGGGDVEEFTNA